MKELLPGISIKLTTLYVAGVILICLGFHFLAQIPDESDVIEEGSAATVVGYSPFHDTYILSNGLEVKR